MPENSMKKYIEKTKIFFEVKKKDILKLHWKFISIDNMHKKWLENDRYFKRNYYYIYFSSDILFV